ncbi:3-isopropylmalate dehydratase small subunit [Beijerinckia sp. L45]|uniref:3-isopropylmalate dehydratase small subunit n=1 Tax=Beijerinckia sp. L45 TaxID=1641855 RepID=UPI00131E4CFE|nr:3-isopropylmalate dehydratase small subunit [Beijerinckia sp. L45]
MQPFTIVSGIAAPLPASNIDTDVIMPKQFLKGVDRSGLSDGVFHDLRFGPLRDTFVLNKSPWQEARFLVVGPNFGCGSSREHAVWGLGQLGFRALIGTSFAGIFFDNCARNGMLAITLEAAALDTLTAIVSDPTTAALTIDLPAQTITAPGGLQLAFDIEPTRKESLILGLDAVGATLQERAAIQRFEQAYLQENPWLA